MDSSLLILIGIICMFFAFVFISKLNKKENDIYSDILVKYKDIKEYSNTMEQIVDNLDKLIDSFLEKHSDLSKKIENATVSKVQILEERKPSIPSNIEHNSENIVKDTKVVMQEEDENKKKDINEQVRDLKKLGLSNHEIAKRLGRGIREIDIISKMSALRHRNSFN